MKDTDLNSLEDFVAAALTNDKDDLLLNFIQIKGKKENIGRNILIICNSANFSILS